MNIKSDIIRVVLISSFCALYATAALANPRLDRVQSTYFEGLDSFISKQVERIVLEHKRVVDLLGQKSMAELTAHALAIEAQLSKAGTQNAPGDYKSFLGTHCIEIQNYNLLKKYEGCPVCSPSKGYLHWCRQGCFVAGTKILVRHIDSNERMLINIEDLRGNGNKYLVVALKSGSTLKQPEYIEAPISFTTSDPEVDALVVITLDNSQVIKLTRKHGVLLADKSVIAASDLQVGQMIVSFEGSHHSVVSVDGEFTAEKVYNFQLLVEDVDSHFVVADNLLMGDQAWQEPEYVHFMGSPL